MFILTFHHMPNVEVMCLGQFFFDPFPVLHVPVWYELVNVYSSVLEKVDSSNKTLVLHVVTRGNFIAR